MITILTQANIELLQAQQALHPGEDPTRIAAKLRTAVLGPAIDQLDAEYEELCRQAFQPAEAPPLQLTPKMLDFAAHYGGCGTALRSAEPVELPWIPGRPTDVADGMTAVATFPPPHAPLGDRPPAAAPVINLSLEQICLRLASSIVEPVDFVTVSRQAEVQRALEHTLRDLLRPHLSAGR